MLAPGTGVEGVSAALNTPGQRGQPRWSTQDGPATISEHGASPAPPHTHTPGYRKRDRTHFYGLHPHTTYSLEGKTKRA